MIKQSKMSCILHQVNKCPRKVIGTETDKNGADKLDTQIEKLKENKDGLNQWVCNSVSWSLGHYRIYIIGLANRTYM